jgi:hypothetical protein
MCDYSLEGVATRPAKVGDELVSSRFALTSTRGFAAADQPNVAVCLLPGTELAFERNVEFEPTWNSPAGAASHPIARFRQVNVDRACMHHDALEFPDGQTVLVTRLRDGQRARVLQLPASLRMPGQSAEAEARPAPEAITV